LLFISLYRERLRLYPLQHKAIKVAIAVRNADRGVVYLKFLWSPYKPRYYWYEVFELCRKLAQTSVIVFVSPGNTGQMVYQVMITVIAVIILNTTLPYIDRDDNILALTAQWVIFMMSFLVLLYKMQLETGLEEYDNNTLNSMQIVLFFSVPALAVFQIAGGVDMVRKLMGYKHKKPGDTSAQPESFLNRVKEDIVSGMSAANPPLRRKTVLEGIMTREVSFGGAAIMEEMEKAPMPSDAGPEAARLIEDYKNKFYAARISFEDQLQQARAAARVEQEMAVELHANIVQLEEANKNIGLLALGSRTYVEEQNRNGDAFQVKVVGTTTENV